MQAKRNAYGTSARVLVTGATASIAAAAALALLAKGEGKGALQPINATSHWMHGGKAAGCDELDATHTLVGFATHFASTVFWALPLEFWRKRHHAPSTGTLLLGACVTSAVAAAVDYGVTPKRFTPGWELVLGKRSMAATYGVLALGLFAGTKLAQALVERRWRSPTSPSRRQGLGATPVAECAATLASALS